LKRFKFPIRTTPEGEANPDGGYAKHDDINSPALYSEPEAAGLEEIPTFK
jgi:adenylylsulfate reductase subunit B